MLIKVLIVLVSCTFFLFACSHFSESPKIEKKGELAWSVVAGVDGGDQALKDFIDKVLKKHGIECFMQGSIRYEILVPSDRVAEARRVLQEDPRLVLQEEPKVNQDRVYFRH